MCKMHPFECWYVEGFDDFIRLYLFEINKAYPLLINS